MIVLIATAQGASDHVSLIIRIGLIFSNPLVVVHRGFLLLDRGIVSGLLFFLFVLFFFGKILWVFWLLTYDLYFDIVGINVLIFLVWLLLDRLIFL